MTEEEKEMAAFVASDVGHKVATTDMGSRKKPRDRIKVDSLIDRLQADIEGDGLLNGAPVKPLTNSQIRGIEILLNKALPNLQAMQMSGDPDGAPIRTQRIERVIIDPANKDT